MNERSNDIFEDQRFLCEDSINLLIEVCHKISVDHGWWENERNDG